MRWMLLFLIAGCLEPSVTLCSDGRTCGEDQVCDDVHHQCVTPGQIASCAAAGDGYECNIVNDHDGVCDQGVCIRALCGDGYRKTSEACDGASNPVTCESLGFYEAGPTACTEGCEIDTSVCVGYCGDGLVTEGREVCDVGVDPILACVDFGYGAGVLGCNMCAPGIEDCKRFGWERTSLAFDPFDVHGTSDTNMFVVGKGGAAFFDGITATPIDLTACFGTTSPWLMSVFVFGDNDAIAGGSNGEFVHLTSTSCSLLPAATAQVNKLWATSQSDVFANIANGAIAHFDGTTWTTTLAAPHGGLWGSSTNDVWTCGDADKVHHWDGTQWSTITVPGMNETDGVWGSSSTDVYVAGAINGDAYVAHYNGATWTKAFGEDGRFGAPQYSFGTYGYTRNGRTYVNGLYGLSNVPRAFMYSNDGFGWLDERPPTRFPGPIFVSPTGTVYTVESTDNYLAVLHQQRFESTVGTEGRGKRLALRGADLLAGTIAIPNTYRWDGRTWVVDSNVVGLTIGVGPNGETYGIDSYFSGAGQGLWQYAPGPHTWSPVLGSEGGYDVSVAGFGDVWFVRHSHELVQYNGTTTVIVHSSLNAGGIEVGGVWAIGHNDVLAVGDSGKIWHWNGTTWADVVSPTTAKLTGVSGRSATELYAWGEGVVLLGNGATWTQLPSPGANVIDLWAGGQSDIWIITEDRGVLRYNGARWAPVDIGTSVQLSSIIGAGDSIYISDEADGLHRIMRATTW